MGHRAIGTYILTLCLEGLILIAGIMAISVLATILGSIGYGVSKVASYENYRLFVLIFSAPAVPILFIYVLVSLLIFSPTAYIIANNDGISAGETIGACYRSMINDGKMTVFLSYFVSSLLRMLYFAVIGVGGYFIFTKFIPQRYFVISLIGCGILSLAGYLSFAPILTLANRVVKEHLFEDIVLDPVTAMRINEKVNLSICNGRKIKTVAPQDLASLFEYTEDPYKILAETERKSERFAVDPPKKKKDKKSDVPAEPEIKSGELTEESISAQPVNQQTN